MIDPLRYRSLSVQFEFDEYDEPVQCWQCLQLRRLRTPAFFFCHECGKQDSIRPFCEPCFSDYHTKRKGKDHHKPYPIMRGDPILVQTLVEGDQKTFPKMHDWVTLDYTLTVEGSNEVIEDTLSTGHPLTFQSGCSGPCVHLQVVGCNGIAAADVLGWSDPYCAVYWRNKLVGVTSTKHMTLDPVWTNQTFVLPLENDFIAALEDANVPTLFSVSASLPKLRLDIYDWDRWSKNDFLGQVRVSEADILRLLRQQRSGEVNEDQVIPFILMPKQSRGKLGIRIAIRGGKLFIHIVRGENLPDADPFSLSDPYCVVYWNERKVGKTSRINDTLDPVWDLEIFLVKVDIEGPNSVEQSTLRIECLDWDRFGSDDVLGQIELKGWQILELTTSNNVGDTPDEEGEAATEGSCDLEGTEVDFLYKFIQAAQQHELGKGSSGGLLVSVPHDVIEQARRQGLESANGVIPDEEEKATTFEQDQTKVKEQVCAPVVEEERKHVEPDCSRKSCRHWVTGIPRGTARHLEDWDSVKVIAGREDEQSRTSVNAGQASNVGAEDAYKNSVGTHRTTTGDHAKEIRHVIESRFSSPAIPIGALAEESKSSAALSSENAATSQLEVLLGSRKRFAEESALLTQPAGQCQKPWAEMATCRDAYVQRFEEDRGVLVQYLDDDKTAWIEARLIPRLNVRENESVTVPFLKRIWDRRHKLLNFHKSLLKAKQGLKVLLDLAMTGSKMHWFPLELTDEQSRAKVVRGTINARLIFHTRGSVLRGLDVAVSHMSLGEEARVEVRSDYGFGEVYPTRMVPPYATLVFKMQVKAIGNCTAKAFLLRRALREALEETVLRFRSCLESLGGLIHSVGKRISVLMARALGHTRIPYTPESTASVDR